MIKRRIVGEVSVNWFLDEKADTKASEGSLLLSQRFEVLIEANRARGFKLESWEMVRVSSEIPGCGVVINETVLAVFEEEAAPTPPPRKWWKNEEFP